MKTFVLTGNVRHAVITLGAACETRLGQVNSQPGMSADAIARLTMAAV